VKGAPGGGVKPSRPINETYLPQAEAIVRHSGSLENAFLRQRAELARLHVCVPVSHASKSVTPAWAAGLGVRKYAYNIGNTLVLGIFEQAVLLAVRRLGNEAYGRAPLL